MIDETLDATGVPETAPPKERTPEERETGRLRVEKHRRIKSQDDSSRRPNCSFEINEATARDILIEERHLRNPHVIETCLALADVAAKMNILHYNRYLFSHGAQKAIAARSDKSGVMGNAPDAPDEWHPGERIREHELMALYDFGLGWREIDGKKYSFEDFKRLRRVAMTDTMEFGNTVLGMAFEDEPHGRWSRELFIQKNPDLLPENYNMESFKTAIAAQSSIHRRLLISSRSSFKSTYNFTDLLSWLFCFAGEMRILILSSTKPLAAGFIKKLRSFLTLKDPRNPTLLNAIFPEYMQAPDEGRSSSYTSPMRRLDLIEPSITSSSLISEGLAGMRCDLLVAEDVVEVSNSSTPEQRQKTYELFSMTCELLEPFGFLQIVGTPYSSGSSEEGDEGDIYTRLLKREEESSDPSMLWVICPCWTVKPGVNKLPYDLTLQPEEVDLLFASRLSFKYLMGKAKENLRQWRQQSLCSWVPDEDEALRVNFDENLLRAHIRPAHFYEDFPIIGKVQTVDVGLSISRYSDRSCCCVAESRRMGQKIIFVIRFILADRLKQSELARAIVETARDYRPDRITLEKSGAWESLSDGIAMAAMLRNIPMPYVNFAATNIGSKSQINKSARIKSLEAPLASDQFWIVSGGWNDMLLAEMTRYDGKKSSASSKKDDICDAVERAFRILMPRTDYQPEKTAVDLEEEARVATVERIRQQHQAMFGTMGPSGWHGKASDYSQVPPAPTQAEVLRPVDPRLRFLPKGMRI